VPVGKDLVLTTDENVNQANLNSMGPRLYRSTQDVNYPYSIPDVVDIKGSNFGPLRYYYFFNWEIDFYDYQCTSDRVPVTVVIDSTLSADAPVWAAGLRVFPNPSSGVLTTELEKTGGGELFVSIKNTQGATLQARRLPLSSGKTTFQHDVSSLPKGIYWLELAANDGVVRRKIIVQ
jgi:hypothetical protein